MHNKLNLFKQNMKQKCKEEKKNETVDLLTLV